jgi:hypothetical protein
MKPVRHVSQYAARNYKRIFDDELIIKRKILSTTISKTLPINYDAIALNIMSNYFYNNVQNKNEFSYLQDYYFVDDDKYITWIHEYIRDHYQLEYDTTPQINNTSGIIIKQGEQINYHHHIDDYDLINSPDISAIVTCKTGDIPTYIQFEYDDGRQKMMKYKVPLERGKLILWSSDLRHCFLKNLNHEPTINLSYQFKLIRR